MKSSLDVIIEVPQLYVIIKLVVHAIIYHLCRSITIVNFTALLFVALKSEHENKQLWSDFGRWWERVEAAAEAPYTTLQQQPERDFNRFGNANSWAAICSVCPRCVSFTEGILLSLPSQHRGLTFPCNHRERTLSHWPSRRAQQWLSSDDIDRYLDQDTADVDIKPGLDRPENSRTGIEYPHFFFLFIVKYVLNLLEDIYFLL